MCFCLSFCLKNDVKGDYVFVDLQMLPVAESDLAFSIHVVLVSAFTMYQIAVYDVSLEHWFSRVCVCGSVLSYRITYRIVNHQV